VSVEKTVQARRRNRPTITYFAPKPPCWTLQAIWRLLIDHIAPAKIGTAACDTLSLRFAWQ
jgi:hypothetical protein